MEIICETESDMEVAAEQVLAHITDHTRLILLRGDLGTGKTTLVKAFCKILGSTDQVSSPTFSLINEYSFSGGVIHHIDLYRLNTLDEALHIGIEDHLYDDMWCFVEWPGIIMPLVAPPFALIDLEVNDPSGRKIRILKDYTEPEV